MPSLDLFCPARQNYVNTARSPYVPIRLHQCARPEASGCLQDRPPCRPRGRRPAAGPSVISAVCLRSEDATLPGSAAQTFRRRAVCRGLTASPRQARVLAGSAGQATCSPHGAALAPPLNRSPQPLTSVRAALPAQSAARPALLLSVDFSCPDSPAPLRFWLRQCGRTGKRRGNETGAFARSCYAYSSTPISSSSRYSLPSFGFVRNSSNC